MKMLFRFGQILWVLLAILSLSAQASDRQFRVGLVLDQGGKDDKSFNSAAYQGLMRVKNELKYFVKYVEAIDDGFEPILRRLAQKKFDLILAVGVSQVDAVKKIAEKFPDQHFALVDGEVDAKNVRSLKFEEHEGSYLMGVLAAMKATQFKKEKVGFIGGMDIPLIRRFQMGYEAGVKATNPKIKVISNFVGVTADSWNNPAKAKELAVTQYDAGAEVIFSAAGASGSGMFDAAEEKGKFAIGVDSNQDWVKPGRILTSMVKRVDEAVFVTCKDSGEGKFTGGTQKFGFANHGVDYTLDSYNEKVLTPEMRKKADEVKAQIMSGEIRVPDYYKLRK